MKKFTLRNLAFFIAASACMALNAQDNVITLTAAGTGSEGDTKYTDSSPLAIDGAGAVIATGSADFHDWIVEGNLNLPNAFNTSFSIEFGAMVISNMGGATFAEKITPRGIDRASTGQMGVRGGSNGGMESLEGLYFGLDLTNIPSDISIRITGIKVQYLGGGEIGTVTSIFEESKTITYSALGDGADVELTSGFGMVDISSFDLILQGGSTEPQMVMTYNSGGTGGYRVHGVELTLIDNNATAIDDEVLNDCNIYPNPFTDVLTIEHQFENSNSLYVELYNLNGQLVKKKYKTSDSHVVLNTSNLPSGLYFCNISDGITTLTKKVIKK